jgi:hypothetical protein
VDLVQPPAKPGWFTARLAHKVVVCQEETFASRVGRSRRMLVWFCAGHEVRCDATEFLARLLELQDDTGVQPRADHWPHNWIRAQQRFTPRLFIGVAWPPDGGSQPDQVGDLLGQAG